MNWNTIDQREKNKKEANKIYLEELRQQKEWEKKKKLERVHFYFILVPSVG